MTLRARLLIVALALAVAALAMTRSTKLPSTSPPATVRAPARPAPAGAPSPPVDPAGIRDVFRFAERQTAAGPPPSPPPSVGVAAPAMPDLPKLVGLVRRQGRLLAAFSQNGDVVLAGPGEAAAGVTVLEVSEESVRVRRKDGSEERLRVP